MYQVSLILCAWCAFFSFSCSAQLFTTQRDSASLRSRVHGAYTALDWEDELSPKGLERESDYSAPTLPNSALVVLEGEHSIYPELAGFGSTNNSLLPSALVKRLDDFFFNLPEITDSAFIRKDRTYLPVFLFYTFADFKITSRVYGKPLLLTDGTYEIPARFYSDASYMDALVFILRDGKEFVIDQIQPGEIVR